MPFHPPCSVETDGLPDFLPDGRVVHPYVGADGKKYVYTVAPDRSGVWSLVPCEERCSDLDCHGECKIVEE